MITLAGVRIYFLPNNPSLESIQDILQRETNLNIEPYPNQEIQPNPTNIWINLDDRNFQLGYEPLTEKDFQAYTPCMISLPNQLIPVFIY